MRPANNLIALPAERTKRRDAKRKAVLRHLRQHLWSSQDLLQQVMSLASRQAAHKTLLQLESESLIKRHSFEALGGKVTLWGITPHGQGMAFIPEKESPISAYFEPSRISEQGIRHQLDLQQLRLQAEAKGWKDWTDGDRIGGISSNGKRPDALVLDSNGIQCAIECERTMKTTKRYEQILVSYLRILKEGTISRVIWACPTSDMANRLRAIIKSIQHVRVAGQRVAIDPDRHHKNLHFISYNKWPNV